MGDEAIIGLLHRERAENAATMRELISLAERFPFAISLKTYGAVDTSGLPFAVAESLPALAAPVLQSHSPSNLESLSASLRAGFLERGVAHELLTEDMVALCAARVSRAWQELEDKNPSARYPVDVPHDFETGEDLSASQGLLRVRQHLMQLSDMGASLEQQLLSRPPIVAAAPAANTEQQQQQQQQQSFNVNSFPMWSNEWFAVEEERRRSEQESEAQGAAGPPPPTYAFTAGQHVPPPVPEEFQEASFRSLSLSDCSGHVLQKTVVPSSQQRTPQVLYKQHVQALVHVFALVQRAVTLHRMTQI